MRTTRSLSFWWIFAILCLNINTSSAVLPPKEIAAMNDLLNAIVPSGLWSTPDVDDPCTWFGVECVNSYVENIMLNFNVSFQIALPTSLQNFDYLVGLTITNATLTAPIPGNFTLFTLTLTSVNNIQWPTSPMLSLFNLVVVGCTAESLPNLEIFPALNWLKISGGSLTDRTFNLTCPPDSTMGFLEISLPLTGPFPDLTLCASLRGITVSSANLTGPIPLAQLPKTLNTIILANNQLTGEIPEEITTFSVLRSLILSFNQLSGTIPAQLITMPTLNVLRLNSNQFSGQIPDLFPSTSNLVAFMVNQNNLTGTIPTTLTRATGLANLDLSDNSLTGEIPLLPVVPTQRFAMRNNRLTGTIPDMFWSNKTYIAIDLSNNQLIGTIPSSLYKVLNITTELRLSNNALSGCVESAVFGPPQTCDLSSNFFCCKSETPMCSVTTNCRTCTGPKPTENATCIVDENGNPVWFVVGNLIISNTTTNTTIENGYIDGSLITTTSITLDGVIVTGNLTLAGDLTVNSGVINVQGCAFVNGSLTLNLTPEEIDAITQNGTITRSLIQYNALCDDSTVNFDAIIVQGDVDCSELTGTQENVPGLVNIIVKYKKIDCPVIGEPVMQPQTPFPDWGIGIIVTAAVVIAGIVILVVLLVKNSNRKRRHRTLSNKFTAVNP